MEDKQHTASEPKTEALAQSLEIMDEKLRQRSEAKKHPFAITEPTAFSEEMLSESPRYYGRPKRNLRQWLG